MHYETNFRTSVFTFVYMSFIIIIVSCDNETPINDSESHYFNTEKPIQSNVGNKNTVSHERLNSSDKSTEERPVSLEGGSTAHVKTEKINNIATTSRTSSPNDSLNRNILELESLPYGLNDSSPTDKKPHKGRKGVELEDINSEETPTDKPTLNVLKTTESRTITRTTSGNVTSTVNSTSEAALNLPVVNSQIIKQELADPVNKSLNGNAVSRDSKNGTNQNITTGSKSSKASKPVTRDDDDIDNSSYSLTATESDYIIPIVATIFAAPLLIVLGMFLYKRSKEFWERRHYRRMDFLIDGMYNE